MEPLPVSPARATGLRARQVLNDAYRALELLEAEANPIDARIHYFAMVALLRAVGHVLEKVDGASNDALKVASARKYKEMKENPDDYEIFFHFIEAERNLILKEYRSHAELVVPLFVVTDLATGEDALYGDGDDTMFPMFIFEDGPFAGEDARDVAPRAIAFWDEYLAQLELDVFGESHSHCYAPIATGVTLPLTHAEVRTSFHAPAT